MNRIIRAFSLAILIATALPSHVYAQNRHNPVLKNVADAGVFRYAGKYYLGGVATDGDFYVSTDLVHWDQKVHVFDLDNEWTHGTGARNNQVHADDITYSGGLFHLLFSVNYWGDDRHIVHITHATSPSIEGPFKEVREDQWFENRIDPQVFCDEDGRLYLYMVKFTDGNTIWARPMNNDFTFCGEAIQQFSSQPGTWETADNRVAEGPFVIKYRGRYYMMYNANHTAVSYGHYRLGVCEAPSPLAFGPGGKYSYPVVSPNTERIDDEHVDLLRYGSKHFNPINLNADTITFPLDEVTGKSYYMKICQNGSVQITLNGTPINPEHMSDYALLPIDSRLLTNSNTLLIQRHNNRGHLVDLALYAMADEEADDLLITPGQPNIVRGPNGWEWWLSYMANTGWSRHQFIDRIHFTGNHLSVDGITGPQTAGFHPLPAAPRYAGTSLDSITLSDAFLLELTFSGKEVCLAQETYSLPASMDAKRPHAWRVEKNHNLLTVWIDGVLTVDHKSTAITTGGTVRLPESDAKIDFVSYCEGWDEYGPHFSGWEGLTADNEGLVLPTANVLKGDAAANYAFSALFTNATPGVGNYGVWAGYSDAKNWVKANIDASRGVLTVENSIKGKVKTTEYPLSTIVPHYPDVKYTDTYEKQYRFDCLTDVTSILLPRHSADADPYASSLSLSSDADNLYLEDIASQLQFSWLDGDTWRPLDFSEVESTHPGWQKIAFPAVRTTALRMINADPKQNSRLIYRIMTERSAAANYQLRVEKRGTDFHLYVDDREITTITNPQLPSSRTGFISDGQAQLHVANTLYYPVY